MADGSDPIGGDDRERAGLGGMVGPGVEDEPRLEVVDVLIPPRSEHQSVVVPQEQPVAVCHFGHTVDVLMELGVSIPGRYESPVEGRVAGKPVHGAEGFPVVVVDPAADLDLAGLVGVIQQRSDCLRQ